MFTLDLHSKQIEGFFKIGVQNFDTTSLFSKLFHDKEKQIVVSPDVGGVMRAQKLADMLNVELAVINKTRLSDGRCIMNNIIGDVANKNCIIIDDIIDTGGTLCRAAELVIENKAKSVSACVTHGVFSGECIKLIENASFSNFYITNSIKHVEIPKTVQVIKVTDIFIDAFGSLNHR